MSNTGGCGMTDTTPTRNRDSRKNKKLQSRFTQLTRRVKVGLIRLSDWLRLLPL